MSDNLDEPTNDFGIKQPQNDIELNTFLDERTKELFPTKRANIYQRAHSVMTKIGVIAKNRQTQAQGKYFYRGIDDVLAALQPLLEEVGLMILPITRQVQTVAYEGKGYLTYVDIDFTFINIDHSEDRFVVPIRGEGFDSLDKGTGKAYSSAYKIMAFQTFCIPTEEASDTEAAPTPKSSNQTQQREGNRLTNTTPSTQSTPPAIKPPDDSQPMSVNGWNKLFALTDQLEVAQDTRPAFIIGLLKKLTLSVPVTFDQLPISSGKKLLVELEAQLKAKNDFFATPSID